MSWALGLSRFIHGLPRPGERSRGRRTPARRRPIDAERQARLLPAVIATLLDVDGHLGTWPPTCVASLLDWAARGCEQRSGRETLLLDGLAALEDGLLRECNLHFEVLSPVLRRHVLDAFARGELGLRAEAARRFMDSFVETATIAFLNVERALAPLPGASTHGANDA